MRILLKRSQAFLQSIGRHARELSEKVTRKWKINVDVSSMSMAARAFMSMIHC
jgi:hypothetical protein